LARAIGGIAAGGVWHHPHLLLDLDKTEKPDVLKVDPAHIKDVIDGMYGVVNEGGTGVRAKLPNIEVCGKTGSAQLASNQFMKGNSRKNMKDNAWFVAFAPRQAPEIVVVSLWENGEHGMLAAPIARDVMKAYFDKKARLAAQAAKVGNAAQAAVGQLQGFGITPRATAAAVAPAPAGRADGNVPDPVIVQGTSAASAGEEDGEAPPPENIVPKAAAPAKPKPVEPKPAEPSRWVGSVPVTPKTASRPQ
jgi:penicillin-binding protein 2